MLTVDASIKPIQMAQYVVNASAVNTAELRATDEKLSQFLMRIRKWLALAIILAVPIAVWVSDRYQSRQYNFSGSLLVLENPTAAKFLGAPDLYQYAVMAKSDEMLMSIAERLTTQTKISGLANCITAKPNRASLDIQLEWRDALEAPKLLNEVLSELVAYSRKYRDENLGEFEADLRKELEAAIAREQLNRESWNEFTGKRPLFSIEDQVQELEDEIRETAKVVAFAERKKEIYHNLIMEIEWQIDSQDDKTKMQTIDEQGDVASNVQRQTLLMNEIKILKERAFAKSELETMVSELERKRRLNAKGLVPSSQVTLLETQVRRLEITLNDDDQTSALRKELDTVANRLADSGFQKRDAHLSELQEALEQAKFQESLEDAELSLNRHHLDAIENDLKVLVRRAPEGLALQDAVALSRKRVDDIRRDLEGIALVKRTHGHSLLIVNKAKPSAQPMTSNRNKLFASSFGAVALMVLIPGLGIEMFRLRQSRGAEIAERYQLPIVGRLQYRPSAQSAELLETANLIALRLDNVPVSNATIVLITEIGTRNTPACFIEAVAQACSRRRKRTLVVQLAKPDSSKQANTTTNEFDQYLRGEIGLENVLDLLQSPLLSGMTYTTLFGCIDHRTFDWQEDLQFRELLKALADQFDVILVTGSTFGKRYEFHALAALADINILTCMARQPDITADNLMGDIVEFNIPVLGIVIRD